MFSLVNFNSMMSKQNIDGDAEKKKKKESSAELAFGGETRPPDHTWEVEHLLLHICKSSLFPVQGDSVSLSGRFSLSLSRCLARRSEAKHTTELSFDTRLLMLFYTLAV